MSMFDIVDFDPADIRAVQAGTASRSQIISILTSQTCGEPCWHAREEICRCSCGGKNHGCLRTVDGVQPTRMSKIDGHPYKLHSVGWYEDVIANASQINRDAGYSSVDKPTMVIDSIGGNYSEEQIAQARAAGREVWFSQYKYTWKETDCGAPARMKSAQSLQLAKWPELAAFKDGNRKPYLLWVRETMPKRPKQLVVDRETGLPLENQNPTR